MYTVTAFLGIVFILAGLVIGFTGHQEYATSGILLAMIGIGLRIESAILSKNERKPL